MKNQSLNKHVSLFEGLRSGDLKDMVYPTISFDQFKSKMGKDKDVVVMSFKVKEKMAATDLMEFIEKGYKFVLDADMSSGEERDGQYSVFVEFERNENVPGQVMEMLVGIGQLCDCEFWQFRYYKDPNLYEVNKENLEEQLPLSEEEYSAIMLSLKNNVVSDFFDQGATDNVNVDEENNLIISKPYSEDLHLKLLDVGSFAELKESIKGGIQLDNHSRNQTVYLEKYLGNYEIYKIDNKFLIKNDDKALIVSKENW
jgi:hypothetical protein